MQEDTFRGDGLNLYTYVANNPLKYVDPTGHCKESVDFSDVYDNILSENPNDILKDMVLRKIMGPDWTPNYLRNSNEIEDYKFKAVIYLNRSDGAFLQGHSAIMLVTDDNQGLFYSFVGDASKTLQLIAGFNSPGKILKPFDKRKKQYVTVDVISFLEKGRIENVEKFKGNDTFTDQYDRYIYIPITNEQGQAMYRKAEMLYKQPPEYNLYANNCNHVAQQILEAGGLNFAPTKGNALDERINLYTSFNPLVHLPPRAMLNYIFDRVDKTIPNAAYNYGAFIANKQGWIAGNTDDSAFFWNPFK